MCVALQLSRAQSNSTSDADYLISRTDKRKFWLPRARVGNGSLGQALKHMYSRMKEV
jgi:hypothetical protein